MFFFQKNRTCFFFMKTLAVGPQETCVMAQNVCKGRLQPLEKKVEQYTNFTDNSKDLTVFRFNRISLFNNFVSQDL